MTGSEVLFLIDFLMLLGFLDIPKFDAYRFPRFLNYIDDKLYERKKSNSGYKLENLKKLKGSTVSKI
jgi:hypothetical protein